MAGNQQSSQLFDKILDLEAWFRYVAVLFCILERAIMSDKIVPMRFSDFTPLSKFHGE